MELNKLLEELEANIVHKELIDANVSNASVGWHIAHTYMTVYAISEALKRSNPADFKFNFKPLKYVVFAMNKIPRGRGKAPNVVQPSSTINEEYLLNLKEKIKVQLEILNGLPANHFFPHPYFGNLKLKQSIRFLNIHTNHHLKIINDIMKSKS
jgi:hypothetical protein